ncbi:MAG: prolyl-tRNA synthetase associated domain-containing protein [Pseudogulbenkiania sp.]|nr:prolyl-tRNA synthetase associated domain-containing protein [Pseudogulbenkiania sp.]
MNTAIYHFLDQHALCYLRFDHPPLFTCEDARRLTPDLPGTDAKNLFLRDAKGKRHILVVLPEYKSADLKALSAVLDAKGLTFASAERLMKYLGITPGSVLLLALINDTAHAVELVIDTALWEADALLAHPLVNTQTLAVPHETVARFLSLTGHTPHVMDMPAST